MEEVNSVLKVDTRSLHIFTRSHLHCCSVCQTTRLNEPMRWTECLLYVWPSAHSPQRFGVPGGGPSDRRPSVAFSLGSLGVKDLGVIKSRFHLKNFFFCCRFFIAPRDWNITSAWILGRPCNAGPFPNKTDAFSTTSLSVYVMRKTSADISAFLGLIRTPETETWSLTECCCLFNLVLTFCQFNSTFVSLGQNSKPLPSERENI